MTRPAQALADAMRAHGLDPRQWRLVATIDGGCRVDRPTDIPADVVVRWKAVQADLIAQGYGVTVRRVPAGRWRSQWRLTVRPAQPKE